MLKSIVSLTQQDIATMQTYSITLKMVTDLYNHFSGNISASSCIREIKEEICNRESLGVKFDNFNFLFTGYQFQSLIL